MGRLIDADKLRYKHSLNTVNTTMPQSFPCITKDEINNAPTVEAIPIPKDATNEDILKAIFPNDAEDIIKYIKAAILNGWLNSKYEGLEDGKID